LLQLQLLRIKYFERDKILNSFQYIKKYEIKLSQRYNSDNFNNHKEKSCMRADNKTDYQYYSIIRNNIYMERTVLLKYLKIYTDLKIILFGSK